MNSQGANTLVGTELHIYDVFSVGGVEIVDGYGYNWKIYTGGGNNDNNDRQMKDLIHLLLSKQLYGGW